MPDGTPSKDDIRAVLKRLGVTQAELGREMHVKGPTISRWLDGDVKSARLDAAVPAFLRGIETGLSRAI